MAVLNGARKELTQEQLQELSTELAKPEYNDMTSGGICQILNAKALIDNPTPQGEVDGSDIGLMEILETIGATLQNVNNLRDNVEGEKVWNVLKDLGLLDLNSTLVIECFNKLVAENLLSQVKVDIILALGKSPDPSWQAKVPGPSKTEDLLEAGWVLEGEDVRMAQGL